MHETGKVFTLLQDLGDDRFFADVALADMLDRDPCFSGWRCRRLAHPVTQRRGKFRIVEGAHMVGIEEPGHPGCVADRGKSSGYHHPAVAG
jgi:hypothetical protein